MATIQTSSIDIKVKENEPTFCKYVGTVGVGLYFLALAIAGGHLYIAAEYTFYFQDSVPPKVKKFVLVLSFSIRSAFDR